jgi:hypothetical protein
VLLIKASLFFHKIFKSFNQYICLELFWNQLSSELAANVFSTYHCVGAQIKEADNLISKKKIHKDSGINKACIKSLV